MAGPFGAGKTVQLSPIESCSQVACGWLRNEQVWGQGTPVRTLDCSCEPGEGRNLFDCVYKMGIILPSKESVYGLPEVSKEGHIPLQPSVPSEGTARGFPREGSCVPHPPEQPLIVLCASSAGKCTA